MTYKNIYRPEIDGLRAFSILIVIIFHLNEEFLPSGFIGVDIFFVISGFLVSSIIYEKISSGYFNIFQFWLNRIRRIIPAIFFLIIIVNLIGAFVLLPNDYFDLGRSTLSQLFFLSNIYFFLKTGYFDLPIANKPLLNLWSLSIEEQYYLIAPLIIILLFNKKFFKSFIVLIFILSFVLCIIYSQDNSLYAFFLLPFRIWEFTLGTILLYCCIKLKNLNIYFSTIISLAGIILLLISLVIISPNSFYPSYYAFLPCIATFLIILSNYKNKNFFGKILSFKFFVFIGLISYSIYLWHWPIITYYKYIKIEEIHFYDYLILITLIFLVSFLAYYFFENPIRKKKILTSNYSFLSLLAFLFLFIFVTSTYVILKKGVPERYKDEFLLTYNLSSKIQKSNCEFQYIDNLKFCVKTNTKINSNTYLIWGDSHAQMLLPIFDKLKLDYIYYDCHPIINAYNSSEYSNLASSRCYNSNKYLINYLNTNKINKIFIASFWTEFLEKKEYKMQGAGQKQNLYSNFEIKSKNIDDSKKVFKKEFINTINLLLDNNFKISIFKQVPQHKYWIPNEYMKYQIFKGDLNNIKRKKSEYLLRVKFLNEIFESLEKNEINYLDPSNVLCDEEYCYAIINNYPLYRDYNHFSIYGLNEIEKLFYDLK